MAARGKVQLTPGQVRALGTAALQGIPLDLDLDMAQKWIGLPKEIWEMIFKRGPDYSVEMIVEIDVAVLGQWQNFYHTYFGLDVDFSNVTIPYHRPGFRYLFIPQGLTPNQIIEAYRRHNIKVWLYTEDLDSAIDWEKEERDPRKGSYSILVRDRQEADEELKGLSADQIAKRSLTTETLTERLVHGLVYYIETGNHLDQDNITLCTGSRYRGGGVPGVGWSRHSGRVCVGSYVLDGAGYRLRAREVVALAA